jgi:hypothetical protein
MYVDVKGKSVRSKHRVKSKFHCITNIDLSIYVRGCHGNNNALKMLVPSVIRMVSLPVCILDTNCY